MDKYNNCKIVVVAKIIYIAYIDIIITAGQMEYLLLAKEKTIKYIRYGHIVIVFKISNIDIINLQNYLTKLIYRQTYL